MHCCASASIKCIRRGAYDAAAIVITLHCPRRQPTASQPQTAHDCCAATESCISCDLCLHSRLAFDHPPRTTSPTQPQSVLL